jgi:hypothetical protein
MLEVLCMKWGSQYTAQHVNVLESMLARNLTVKHRLTCFTDNPEGVRCRTLPLPDTVKGQQMSGKKRRYIKLWAYSDEMREHLAGDRLLCLDLDIVITGSIDHIVSRKEEIVFWDDPHQHTPYNSSVVLMTAGSRNQVWDEFDPKQSPKRCETSVVIGHDQNWASQVLGANEATWTKEDGIYSMRNDVMKHGLKENACIVVFHGPRDPAMPDFQRKYPWIQRHWYI